MLRKQNYSTKSIHYCIQQAPTVAHNQGATINCLESKIKQLTEGCKKQILRVAELSADDYHNDRSLFFACRDDRERFCEAEAAGQGQIYKCLLKHKFKEDMSEGVGTEASTIISFSINPTICIVK